MDITQQKAGTQEMRNEESEPYNCHSLLPRESPGHMTNRENTQNPHGLLELRLK